MLRDLSGRYAWMAPCAVSIVVFGVLNALKMVENARLMLLFLAAYLLVQYGARVFFYRQLSQNTDREIRKRGAVAIPPRLPFTSFPR